MSNELQDLISRLTKKAVQPEAEATPPPPTTADDTEKVGDQMAFWPEEVAAMPTELTRVSLFGLIRRGRRKVLNWEKLDSRADIEVQYFGCQLDQADADLWLACLRAGRGLPMGQRIYMTRAALLHEIGRNDGTSARKWLETALDRMSGATLKITIKRNGKTVKVTSGMLKWGIEEETGAMFIRLDPDGAALFDNLAYLGWEERLSLSSNMAKALQLYISGHQKGKPHSQPISNVMHWCGYEGRLRQFRAALPNALKELEKAGVIKQYKVSKGPKGDLVSWQRT